MLHFYVLRCILLFVSFTAADIKKKLTIKIIFKD